MKEHADKSGNHPDLWPLKICLTTQSNGYSFLLIPQYEMPFINKSEATKRPKDRKINGKGTNGMNRSSRVWPVCFIYIRDERNDLERTSSADAKTSWYFAFSMSSKWLSASDTAVSPIEDASAIWSCTMLFTVNVLHAWTLADVRFQYSCEWFVNEFDWHAFATRLKDKDHVPNNRIIQLKISHSNDWKWWKFL